MSTSTLVGPMSNEMKETFRHIHPRLFLETRRATAGKESRVIPTQERNDNILSPLNSHDIFGDNGRLTCESQLIVRETPALKLQILLQHNGHNHHHHYHLALCYSCQIIFQTFPDTVVTKFHRFHFPFPSPFPSTRRSPVEKELIAALSTSRMPMSRHQMVFCLKEEAFFLLSRDEGDGFAGQISTCSSSNRVSAVSALRLKVSSSSANCFIDWVSYIETEAVVTVYNKSFTI